MRPSGNDPARWDARRPGRPAGRRPWRAAAALALAATLLLTSACSGGGGDKPSWNNGSAGPGGTQQQAEQPKPAATITTPASEAKKVPTSTAVVFTTLDNAGDATVTLKDAAGKAVKGALQADGKTWLPAGQLKYDTTYTAAVTATVDGKASTVTSRFTTMAEPDKQVRVTSLLDDGAVVGIAMPLIVQFGRDIPQKYRDDVQRRMTVQSTPKQEGIWHWVSPSQVHYRPKVYWKPNTKIYYKLQTGGLPMGDGWYGRSDLTIDMKIGRALIMTVDNRTKRMTVTRDGKVVKTIPVSLGKPKTPSSSGTMVVMEKLRKTIFDTRRELGPVEGYRTKIDYAQRLTWGGEFIHAAPWSENVQGRRNVSHGCVNVSMALAGWLFNQTMLGDPVTVKGTEVKLQNGNGWTDWNMSWADYVKGSAIPPGE